MWDHILYTKSSENCLCVCMCARALSLILSRSFFRCICVRVREAALTQQTAVCVSRGYLVCVVCKTETCC